MHPIIIEALHQGLRGLPYKIPNDLLIEHKANIAAIRAGKEYMTDRSLQKEIETDYELFTLIRLKPDVALKRLEEWDIMSWANCAKNAQLSLKATRAAHVWRASCAK
jgi:hypothetical protein